MTATATGFSLRLRIRQIVENSETADPKVIADEVLASISTEEAVAALTECLPEYVRVVVQSDGRRRAPAAGLGRSWKTEAAKAYAQKILRQRVDVSGVGVGWKFLAECTSDDLDAVASNRRKQADELVSTAAWFEKIAALLDEHSVETVKDLPEAVLSSLATNGEVAA